MKSFSTLTTLKVVVLAVLVTVTFVGCAAGDTDEQSTSVPKTERCSVDLQENGDFIVVATFDELRKSTDGASTVELTSKPGTVIDAGDISDGVVEGDWTDTGLGSNHVTITKVNAPQEAATVLNISGHTDAKALDCNAHR